MKELIKITSDDGDEWFFTSESYSTYEDILLLKSFIASTIYGQHNLKEDADFEDFLYDDVFVINENIESLENIKRNYII